MGPTTFGSIVDLRCGRAAERRASALRTVAALPEDGEWESGFGNASADRAAGGERTVHILSKEVASFATGGKTMRPNDVRREAVIIMSLMNRPGATAEVTA